MELLPLLVSGDISLLPGKRFFAGSAYSSIEPFPLMSIFSVSDSSALVTAECVERLKNQEVSFPIIVKDFVPVVYSGHELNELFAQRRIK